MKLFTKLPKHPGSERSTQLARHLERKWRQDGFDKVSMKDLSDLGLRSLKKICIRAVVFVQPPPWHVTSGFLLTLVPCLRKFSTI